VLEHDVFEHILWLDRRLYCIVLLISHTASFTNIRVLRILKDLTTSKAC